jgi:DNA polymerase-3 subunit alpha
MELGIDSFKDVYDALALYRPGPLRSGMSYEFIERKKGKSWKAIHENVKVLTKDTYGIILYQEQVMNMAKELAGFDWGKCNKLRKVIAKSKGADEFNKYREDFIQGCIDNETLNHSQAKQLFEDIVSFAAYGFNLSHSVEYAFLAMQGAWLKHYFPEEFYASALSHGSVDNNEKILKLVRKRGMKISLPKTELSDPIKWKIKDNTLIMPLKDIIGVGDSMAETIVKQNKTKRTGFFKTVSSVALPTKIKQILVNIKAFDSNTSDLKYNDIKNMNKYIQYDLFKIYGY